MAHFIPGPLGTVTGALGGLVFRPNGGGLTVQLRSPHVGQPNAAELIRLAQVQRAQHDWIDLTDDERNAWATAAATFPQRDRLGRLRTLPPRQYYIQQSMLAQHTGIATPDPTTTLNPSLTFTLDDLGFTGGGVTLNITAEVTFPAAPNGQWIFCSIGNTTRKAPARTARPRFRMEPLLFSSMSSGTHFAAFDPDIRDIWDPIVTGQRILVDIHMWNPGAPPGITQSGIVTR